MPKNQSSDSLVFAVDLGGTHLRVALVDDSGKILKQVKQETPRGESAGCIVNALANAAEQWSDEKQRVVAVSIMVPGAVDSDKAVVLQAPNLPSLANFGLKAALQEGVRGGLILDGELWRGSHGSAGEIGHTAVDPFSGLKCKCGNIGCLELFASATAIVRMTRENLSLFPDSRLKSEELTAETVYDAGREGDELALAVFKRFGMYLGIGLATIINLIDPEIIVITGGAANGWDLFSREMYRQVEERAFRTTAQQVRIARAECGDNAGLLGAARLAQTALTGFL